MNQTLACQTSSFKTCSTSQVHTEKCQDFSVCMYTETLKVCKQGSHGVFFQFALLPYLSIKLISVEIAYTKCPQALGWSAMKTHASGVFVSMLI